jgi:hypothetical protein
MQPFLPIPTNVAGMTTSDLPQATDQVGCSPARPRLTRDQIFLTQKKKIQSSFLDFSTIPLLLKGPAYSTAGAVRRYNRYRKTAPQKAAIVGQHLGNGAYSSCNPSNGVLQMASALLLLSATGHNLPGLLRSPWELRRETVRVTARSPLTSSLTFAGTGRR